jgi:hypothetical protein
MTNDLTAAELRREEAARMRGSTPARATAPSSNRPATPATPPAPGRLAFTAGDAFRFGFYAAFGVAVASAIMTIIPAIIYTVIATLHH